MGAPPRRLAPRETTCCAGRCSDVRVVSRPVQRLRARGSQFSCHTPARALVYALPAGSGYTATPLRVHGGGKQPRRTGRKQVEMTDRRSIERGRPETRREEPAGHRWTGNGRTPRERGSDGESGESDRTDTNREETVLNQLISDRHVAGGLGEGPRGGQQDRETRRRKQAHAKQRSRDADD